VIDWDARHERARARRGSLDGYPYEVLPLPPLHPLEALTDADLATLADVYTTQGERAARTWCLVHDVDAAVLVLLPALPVAQKRADAPDAGDTPDPWLYVPPAMRSIVRAYINSEQEQDRDRALVLCDRYHLDYAVMRKVIAEEMRRAVEEARDLAGAPDG
jgi:hypothetical protein